MKLPKPIIEEQSGILIVRDDYLLGGTKRRVAHLLFDGSQEVVYASPAFGYAQVALAYAGRDHGLFVTIFTAKRRQLHPRTLEAKKAGAKIVLVPYGYLSNVQSKAKKYAQVVGAKYLPFGFDCSEVIRGLGEVATELDVRPREVWTVAGSGTLSKALQQAWPQAQFFAVRIGAQVEAGRAHMLTAPEKFEQKALRPPPFPSCTNYDAKAWQFMQAQAQPGALFWNVAA